MITKRHVKTLLREAKAIQAEIDLLNTKGRNSLNIAGRRMIAGHALLGPHWKRVRRIHEKVELLMRRMAHAGIRVSGDLTRAS